MAMGLVPVEGEDERFPKDDAGPEKFTIRAEKCPNRRGIEMLLKGMGGSVATFDEFVEKAGEGAYSAVWIAGGYPKPWVTKELAKAAGKIGMIFAQDLFGNAVTEAATVVVPSCAWVERSGCFVNVDGKVQPFEAAIAPPDGCQRDGRTLYALAGETGLYDPERIRKLMAETMPAFGDLHAPPEKPKHAH